MQQSSIPTMTNFKRFFLHYIDMPDHPAINSTGASGPSIARSGMSTASYEARMPDHQGIRSALNVWEPVDIVNVRREMPQTQLLGWDKSRSGKAHGISSARQENWLLLSTGDIEMPDHPGITRLNKSTEAVS